jgi:hypothetical protein
MEEALRLAKDDRLGPALGETPKEKEELVRLGKELEQHFSANDLEAVSFASGDAPFTEEMERRFVKMPQDVVESKEQLGSHFSNDAMSADIRRKRAVQRFMKVTNDIITRTAQNLYKEVMAQPNASGDTRLGQLRIMNVAPPAGIRPYNEERDTPLIRIAAQSIGALSKNENAVSTATGAKIMIERILATEALKNLIDNIGQRYESVMAMRESAKEEMVRLLEESQWASQMIAPYAERNPRALALLSEDDVRNNPNIVILTLKALQRTQEIKEENAFNAGQVSNIGFINPSVLQPHVHSRPTEHNMHGPAGVGVHHVRNAHATGQYTTPPYAPMVGQRAVHAH